MPTTDFHMFRKVRLLVIYPTPIFVHDNQRIIFVRVDIGTDRNTSAYNEKYFRNCAGGTGCASSISVPASLSRARKSGD